MACTRVQPLAMLEKASTAPAVSVVMPVYNREKSVGAAIRSVLGQTFADFELLVVDDASTDGSREVVMGFADPRISLLVHDTNLYAGAARNTGMKRARGEFIAFLDSDDTWYPNKLAEQLELFRANRDAYFCCTGVRMMKGRGIREKKLLPRIAEPRPTLRFLTGQSFIIPSTVVFRRSILSEVGMMDPALRRNQDVDFFLRIMRRYPVNGIEKPLVDFFPNSDTPPAAVIAESGKRLLRQNRETIEQAGWCGLRRVEAYFKIRHGQRLLVEGQLSAGVAAVAGAVWTWPFLAPRQYAAALYRLLNAVRVRARKI